VKTACSFIDTPMSWRLPAAVLWALALLFLSVAAIAGQAVVELRAALPELESRLARGRSKLAAQPAVQLPTRSEIEALRTQIAAWNRVSGIKGWGTSQLLTWLESNTPATVYFVSLQHEPKKGEVELVANSSSPAALTTFLRTLENEPAFSQVLLSRQGGGRGATGASQFEIQIKLAP
jgi:hypothetical protein